MGTFTPKQEALIVDVLVEASELLGSDASQLPLPESHAERLGFLTAMTYGQALWTIAGTHDGRKARDLTRAVLGLRQDPRVQGWELDLTGD